MVVILIIVSNKIESSLRWAEKHTSDKDVPGWKHNNSVVRVIDKAIEHIIG